MGIIPLSQDEKLIVADEESKVSYFFRPLVGANEQEYLRIVTKFKGAEDQRPILDEMIDFILIGWDSCIGTKFDPEKKSSSYFNFQAKNKLFDMALNANNIGEDEAKN
jgi:hypothetical protein